jgi:hypothetical protein
MLVVTAGKEIVQMRDKRGEPVREESSKKKAEARW